MTEVNKKPRGFAAFSPERRREISRKGGKAAHQQGTAHEFTREEAATAGQKGGLATAAAKRAKDNVRNEAMPPKEES